MGNECEACAAVLCFLLSEIGGERSRWTACVVVACRAALQYQDNED